jgi:hypothetical protein
MKKFLVSILSVVLMFTVVICNYVGASEVKNDGNVKEKVKIEDGVYIEIFEDGRIAAVNKDKVNMISEKAIDKILKQMQFSEVDIASFHIEEKKEIVNLGGVSIPLTITDKITIYEDLEGNEI